MSARVPLGPVMVDLEGTALQASERSMLMHPLVGGVILFARNYESPAQLCALTAEIAALRDPKLLISVDHEGGRVQRFRDGFTHIPAMRRLGILADRDPAAALATAEAAGYVLATELLSCGVDFSFTPVLDVDYGLSSVIGDRAFDSDPTRIGELAGALLHGMGEAGVAGVGKHFPGHGHVGADSHVAVPVDERELARIEAEDLLPYRMLIPKGLEGVMPAHVIYPKVDSRPAGFSQTWLMQILRGQLGFEGMIFSDDLSMEGASVGGDITARAKIALDAGCDMVLVCNAPNEAARLLRRLEAGSLHAVRSDRMRGRRSKNHANDRRYAAELKALNGAFA